MTIKFITRPGSVSGRQLRNAFGDRGIRDCDKAVNFGLQGDALRNYERRWPRITQLPIMNHHQFGNKFQHLQAAEDAGLSVPESMTAHEYQGQDGYIAKPYYSAQGRGIYRINSRSRRRQLSQQSGSHYVQREITNRRYEMRVHAFKWVDPRQWVFQKRLHERGDEVLAWNHDNGGNFVTINEPTDPLHDRIRADITRMFDLFGYQFGAVDFIVQTPGESGARIPHYFIEWNLCPGWTLDHVRDAYIRAFNDLTHYTPQEFRNLITNRARFEERLQSQQDEAMFTADAAAAGILRGRVRADTPQVQNVPRNAVTRVSSEHLWFSEPERERPRRARFCTYCGGGLEGMTVARFCPLCGHEMS